MEKRHFQDTISIYTNCTANLPTLIDFEKKSSFSVKTPAFFPKPQFRTYLKNVTISVAFCRKFTIIWWLKISNSESSVFCLDNWQVHVKKCQRWVDAFAFIFKYGRQITKVSEVIFNKFATKCKLADYSSDAWNNIQANSANVHVPLLS